MTPRSHRYLEGVPPGSACHSFSLYHWPLHYTYEHYNYTSDVKIVQFSLSQYLIVVTSHRQTAAYAHFCGGSGPWGDRGSQEMAKEEQIFEPDLLGVDNGFWNG